MIQYFYLNFVQKILCLFLFAVGAVTAYCQDVTQNAAALSKYEKEVLHEKIFVHTDQSFYITGQTIWFKAYVTDGINHRPVDLSKVAYMELIDKNQAVLQTKIALKNGSGSGSLFVPATLRSGNYTLRAYTRWMRNFGHSFYFSKTITVLNPFKPLEKSDVTSETPLFDVQFFPEGGNLVNGIESKVAFRAVNRSGKGITFDGYVTDEEGNTVVQFKPLKFGIGNFMFTPVAEKTYTAVLTDSLGRVFSKTKLPEAYRYGYVMHVSEIPNERLQVTVKAQQPPGAAQTVYLLAHTRGSLKINDSRLLQDGLATFIVERNKVGDGITHFTVFNASNEPVCERLYFKRGQPELAMNVKATSASYKTRTKVSVDLQVDEGNMDASVDLSMSVYRIDSLQLSGELPINSYLLLTSDVQGVVESPAYYFGTEPEAMLAVDNLMLTHGWRRFSWQEVLKEEKRNFSFIPEYRGQIVQARVTESSTGDPAAGVTTYLSIPGKKFHLRGAQSDRMGNVLFELRNFYGHGKVIIQTDHTKDSIYNVAVSSPYSAEYTGVAAPPFTVSEELKTQIETRSINMQLRNVFFEAQNSTNIQPTDSSVFYGEPDERYFLDTYTRFPVMEEVMREYVRAVIVRKRKDNFHFLVYDKVNDKIFKDDPLVLLDGVPVFDIDKIMRYDPLKIRRLDVVTKKYFYGPLTFEGIVSYTTYTGDLPDFIHNPRTSVLDYDGVQFKKDFFAPVYETSEQMVNRLPDFREVLLWKPELTTDKSGRCHLEFFTSDQPGKYSMVIHGLSTDGRAGSFISYFEVLPQENN